MNSNLIVGRTMKSEKQIARDSVRALNASRINLEQALRFGSEKLIAMSQAAIRDHSDAVAYWTAKGSL
jgi:hypothetical protein